MKTAVFALLASALGLPLVVVAGSGPVPEVSLSLRGVRQRTVEVGEPIFVAVRFEAPEGTNGAIELNPASGTWADAVEVEMVGLSDRAAKVRARPAMPPESKAITLDTERTAGGVWLVSSAVTRKLTPGQYVVTARLAIEGGKGWTGEATSEESALHVVPASSAPERVRQRALALAHEALSANAPEEAARVLDEPLTSDPDDIPLLTARAAVCARAGDYRAAMVCVNRAIARFERDGGTHPPTELFELENQISLALLSPAKTDAAPPSWTKLPVSVVAPSEEKRLPMATPASATPVAVASVASTPSPLTATKPQAVAATPSAGVVVPASELVDAKIIADPAGQWATSAKAGSQYGATNYSAAKMAGAPDVPKAGDSGNAWCPHSSSKSLEWIELTYAVPVLATEVRVRQNSSPGAIVKVEALEPDGTAHVWWEGIDPYQPGAVRDIAWFVVRVPKTSYLVAKMKITLNLASGSGWKEIDAVQLVGMPAR